MTTTRALAPPMTSVSASATSASEGLMPSRRILVESQTSASTPSSPIAVSLAESVGKPSPGSGSIFQSPDVNDYAVRRTNRQRAAFRYRMRDGDQFHIERVKRDALTLFDRGDLDIRRIGNALELCGEKRGGKGCREDRTLKTRPEFRDSADMVFMRVRDNQTEKIAFDLLDKGEVRRTISTPASSEKAMPQSTISHLRLRCGPTP